jgi:hypothetical protein
MSKRIFGPAPGGITPTATADATNLANNTGSVGYVCAAVGISAIQKTTFYEFYQGGLAATSAPTIMVVARDSTLAVTLGATISTEASADGSMVALGTPMLIGNVWTTLPQRATALHLLNLSYNAFGGIVRWVAAPGEELVIVGNAVNTGELSWSAFTGGTPGLMSAHVVFETA